MHSSRMRIARSSSHRGGGVWSWSPWISHLDVGLDLIPLNSPLGCGPGSDPPQFSPLGVGLNLIPLNFPLGCGPGSDPPQFPLGCGPGSDPPSISPPPGCGPGGGVSLAGGSPWQGRGGVLGKGVYPSMHWGRPPPPLLTEMADACENITLPQTLFEGGKKILWIVVVKTYLVWTSELRLTRCFKARIVIRSFYALSRVLE